jgi:ketosteroid isomerase-like protein
MRLLPLTLALVAAAATALPAQAPGAPPAIPPAAAPLPSATLPPELERVLRDYERAWQARDAAALAANFTDDGFVLANGRPPVRGQAAIREAYAESGGPLHLRALGYAAGDTVGYIVGAFATRAGEADQGKFVLALRRAPGGPWRIAADIDNPNRLPRMGPRPAADTARRPPAR